MRLLTFQKDDYLSWGWVHDQGIVDAGARIGNDVQTILHNGQIAHLTTKIDEWQADFALDEVDYLPPISAPEKIICIGVNYTDRHAEYKDGTSPHPYPSVFMRTIDSLTGHKQPLLRPPESDQLDYEGEIVLVIGTAGRRIAEKDAYRHIAALTIMNEGTVRDWVRHAKFNVTQGKNFFHSGAIGPWLVSADELASQHYENMRITTRVNGEVRQDDTTANMMFPFRYIISYLSTFFYLKPGDLIATGTPNGAGARFDPPRYLVPGDRVEVEVPLIGTLTNFVRDE